jgi:hypothetical protein
MTGIERRLVAHIEVAQRAERRQIAGKPNPTSWRSALRCTTRTSFTSPTPLQKFFTMLNTLTGPIFTGIVVKSLAP